MVFLWVLVILGPLLAAGSVPRFNIPFLVQARGRPTERLKSFLGPLLLYEDGDGRRLDVHISNYDGSSNVPDIVVLSESQYYALEMKDASCWLPAVARGSLKGGAVSFDLSKLRGVFYVCSMVCSLDPVAYDLMGTFSVSVVTTGTTGDRLTWWVGAFFIIEAIVFGLSFWSSQHRMFWIPLALLLSLSVILTLTGTIIRFNTSAMYLIGPARSLEIVRALWRALASLYLTWFFLGDYLIGSRGWQPSMSLKSGLMIVSFLPPTLAMFCSFWPTWAGSIGSISSLLWATFAWIPMLYLAKSHLKSNKVVLDARLIRVAIADAELLKRLPLRMMRGTSQVGLAFVLASVPFFLGGPNGILIAQRMLDLALVIPLAGVILLVMANIHASQFIEFGGQADRRRQLMVGLQGIMERVQGRFRNRPNNFANVPDPNLERDEPMFDNDENNPMPSSEASSPPGPTAPELTESESDIGVTTDLEDDITAPDVRHLLSGNSNHDLG